MQKVFLLFAPLLFVLVTASLPASAEPDKVRVGAYLNDIQDLDLKEHSYKVDLYVWFLWEDPKLDPAATMEFMNPFELWGHTKSLEFETPQKRGKFLYQVVRVQGGFSKKLPLYDYPFDRQSLVVSFEDSRHEARAFEYIPDPEGVVLNPELKLPGFLIGKPALQIKSQSYPTKFGDSQSEAHTLYSRVRIEVPMSRPVITYSLKLLLPILCVVFCAMLMFLFHPRYVDVRVGIGITALLTIVALQITLNEDLPEVDYLVLMDKIYIAAYLFVILGLASILRSTFLLDRGAEADAVRLDRLSLKIISGTFVIGVTAILLFSLYT